MNAVGQIINFFLIILVVVAVLATLVWAIVWTVAIFGISVNAAKKVNDDLRAKGASKPIAFFIAIVVAIAAFLFLSWLMSQKPGGYYNY